MGRKKKVLYKILLIGDAEVGKTSTFYRYVDNKVPSTYKVSMGADFLLKKIELDDAMVSLQLWDTAGAAQFRGLGATFFRNADAFLLCYDLTRPETLDHIAFWLQEIKKHAFVTPHNCVFMLVGNKADLIDQRQVTDKAVQTVQEQIQQTFHLAELPQHLTISAKTGERVGDLFIQATKKLLAVVPDYDDVLLERKEIIDVTVPEPYNKKQLNSRISGSVTSILSLILVIVVASVFWPAIIALPVFAIVLLAIAAVAFITASTAAATAIAYRCTDSGKPVTEHSTSLALSRLGVTKVRNRSPDEMLSIPSKSAPAAPSGAVVVSSAKAAPTLTLRKS